MFIAPGCTFANDVHPGCACSKYENMKGPTIRRGARIGVNVTITPGVEIGACALVGSGAVVTRDVEPASRVPLNGGPPRRVSRHPGTHTTTVSPDASNALRTLAKMRPKRTSSEPTRTREIKDAIAEGLHPYGMITFDQSLASLVKQRLVTYEEAVKHSTSPSDFALLFRGVSGTASGQSPGAAAKGADNEFEIDP